jgi:hypothetical protein
MSGVAVKSFPAYDLTSDKLHYIMQIVETVWLIFKTSVSGLVFVPSSTLMMGQILVPKGWF